MVESAGFGDIEVRFLARVPDRERRMAEIYNRNTDILNDLLFGPEGYAVVARKRPSD